MSASHQQDFLKLLTEKFRSTEISYLCGDPSSSEWSKSTAPNGCIFVANQFTIESEKSSDGSKQLFLRISQEDYIVSSCSKLLEKGCISQLSHLEYIDPKDFSHSVLTEDCASNPLLSKDDQTFLRSIINTISYSTGTRLDLSVPVQTLARGQASGRLRHLQGARSLVNYAHSHRRRSFRLKIRHVDMTSGISPQVYITGDFDASLGNTGVVSKASGERTESDGHARMGVILFLAVGHYSNVSDANAAGWSFFSRSTLSATVAVGTSESELSCCSWATKEILAAVNFCREVLPFLHVRSPVLYGDNSACVLIASGESTLRAVRHLSLQRLFCRWASKENLISFREKRGAVMTADILTKVLDRVLLAKMLGLLHIVE